MSGKRSGKASGKRPGAAGASSSSSSSLTGLLLSTYRYGDPRPPGEGLRVGTTRYLPRGVSKANYARLDRFDVWLPLLAPSRDLLRSYRDGRPFDDFARRYEREMAATDPRQAIALLAALAARTPLAVGCYCDDESLCHRSVLARLIREAA